MLQKFINMDDRGRQYRIDFIQITIFVLLAVFSQIIFLQIDNSIEGVDSTNHLLFSLEFHYKSSDIFNNISQPFILRLKEFTYFFTQPVAHSTVYWPNGLNLSVLPWYFLFGLSLIVAKMSLLLYLCILLFSVYCIGRLYFSHQAGMFSAYTLFMYPIIFESSRQFQLDFPLTAMIAITVLLVLKTEYFSSIKYSVLSGLVLGWAMLIKGQAVLFILGPLFFILDKIRHDSKVLSWKTMRNMVVFLSCAVILAGLWWVTNFAEMIASLKDHMWGVNKAIEEFYPDGISKKFSFFELTYYIRALFSSIGWIGITAFAIAVGVFKKKLLEQKYILSVFLIPFILFAVLFTIKSARFLMPGLFVIALVTGAGVCEIKNRKIKRVTIIILGVIMLVQFCGRSYGIWNQRYESNNVSFFPLTQYETVPQKRDLIFDEIIREIRAYSPAAEPVYMGIIAAGESDGLEIIYWLRLYDEFIYPIDIMETSEVFYESLDSFDFIIFASHPRYGHLAGWPQGEQLGALLKRRFPHKSALLEVTSKDVWNGILNDFGGNREKFHLVKKVRGGRYGYNSYYIYKRRQ
ncbi:MAG: hypothetical protein GY853_02670 [PVC group bacterium]|nr:hypothetical protein [PVC group bacterium]